MTIASTLRARALPAVALIGALSLGACAGLTDTQQRTVTGAGAGAAVGAVGTALTGGCVSCGAAIGGVVGGAGGYLFDQSKKGKI